MTNKSPIKAIKSVDDFNAYLNFIQNEIKLQNSIKSMIMSRIELDTKHAKDITTRTLFKVGGTLDGFIMEKCWSVIQNQIDDINKVVLDSCKKLEREVVPKLDSIIKEKSEAKNRLIDEKKRYDENLKALKTASETARTDYIKAANSVDDVRRRFFEKKNLDKTPKRITEIVNNGSRLHQAHNNYLLALGEYNKFSNLLREYLFPNLIATHQESQERLLEEFQSVLAEFYNHVNQGRSEFQEKYNAIKNEVVAINPQRDYTENILSLNQNNPNILYNEKIDFDKTSIEIIGDFLTPLLRADIISVTQPTISGLNDKQLRLKQKLEDFNGKIEQFGNEVLRIKENIQTASSLADELKLITLSKDKTDCETQVNSIQGSYDELAEYVTPYNNGVEAPEIKAKIQSDPGVASSSGYEERFKPPVVSNVSRSSQGLFPNGFPTIHLPGLTKKDKFDHSLELADQPWFHGSLPRKDVESELLRNEGDFLVRESSNVLPDKPPFVATSYVVSLKGADKCIHYIIYQNNESGKFKMDENGTEFDKVSKMLEFYMSEKENIENAISLIRPVPRETWEIRDSDLKNVKEIDSGNFGIVSVGLFKNKKVAIKSLKLPDGIKVTTSNEEKAKFLAEGRLLQKYNHTNIVRFIGIAIDTDPIKIVMEYVDGGSLINYIKQKRDIPVKQSLKFCEECASGMEYLEANRVIHRDLAARNCLLTSTLELRITDFGLSRELQDGENTYAMSCYRAIPFRWSAPEVFKGKFTCKSDVWSYGVTVWEIFTNGEIPYRKYSNDDAKRRISTGEKLECPQNAHDRIFLELMDPCWNTEPDSRPDFATILKTIKQLMKISNELS